MGLRHLTGLREHDPAIPLGCASVSYDARCLPPFASWAMLAMARSVPDPSPHATVSADFETPSKRADTRRHSRWRANWVRARSASHGMRGGDRNTRCQSQEQRAPQRLVLGCRVSEQIYPDSSGSLAPADVYIVNYRQ